MSQKNSGKGFQCPTCNESFPSTTFTPDMFTTDCAVLQLIRHRSQKRCQDHNEELRFFCILDQIPICDDCYLVGNHKGHEIWSIKMLADHAAKKKKKLEQLLHDNVIKRQKMEEEIDMKFIQMHQFIKSQFFEMREILNQRESEAIQRIENTMKSEKDALIKKFNDNQSRFEDQVADISQNEFEFRPPDQQDINLDDYDLSIAEANSRLEDLYIKMQEILGKFVKTAGSLSLEETQRNDVSIEETPRRETSTEDEEPVRLKKEALSPSPIEIFKRKEHVDLNDEEKDCLKLKRKVNQNNRDEMEEEINEEDFRDKLRKHTQELNSESFLEKDDLSVSSNDKDSSLGEDEAPKDINSRKYMTISPSIKKKIVTQLQKEILVEANYQSDPKKVSLFQFLQIKKNIDTEKCHQIIAKVLKKYIPNSSETTKNPKSLNVKINRWVQKYYDFGNNRKPNSNKYCACQSNQWFDSLKVQCKLGFFKEKLKRILRKMSAQDFSTLCSRVLQVLPELICEKQDAKKLPKSAQEVFSYSWWTNFLKKNKDCLNFLGKMASNNKANKFEPVNH